MMKLRHGACAALVLLLLLPCPSAFSQQNPEPQAAPIHVGVNLVTVGVIVTDADGRFVRGLPREDFTLSDDGVAHNITYFALDQPSHVLLLIEAGPAVYLVEGGHLSAAFGLLKGLSPDDQVAVVKYAEGPEAICDFSPDKRIAASALEHLHFNLGFGALNLSDSMASVLDWLDKTQGKKTIVLLSSGVDTSAPEAANRLLERLRIGGVRVLAVSLSGELRPSAPAKKKQAPSAAAVASTQQFAAADGVLRQVASATGGRAYFPVDAKGFEATFAEIAQIVRNEYVLGFSPTELDGRVHRIEVRIAEHPQRGVANAGGMHDGALRVDHRQAYLAAPTATP
ncbi:MAG: VWA domain-containing protein [Candidatus Acidiferrum sp.]|jgi:Ca-activated chloride channel family protein